MRDEIIKRNILITITSLMIFFVLSFFVTSYSSRKTIENQLISITNVINNRLKETNSDEETVNVAKSFTNNQEWLQIIITNTYGDIVFDSNDDSSDVNKKLESFELNSLNSKVENERVYILNEKMCYISKINDDFLVKTTMKIESNTSFILNSLFYLLIIVMVVLVVSIIYTRKTSMLVTDAFLNISKHLKTINDGEYEQIETHHKFKEVEDSLIEINDINENIYSSMKKIKTEHDKINFIIDNIKQGMIIIDENKHIVLINDFAKRILRLKSVFLQDEPYDKIFVSEINKKIDKAQSKKIDLFFDYTDSESENIYLFSLSNIEQKWNDIENVQKLVVIIITDVTEERNNDAIKAEFIANASHELKTPITSIGGFSELLLENNSLFDERTNKYLKIIFNESVKMKETIDELLYLSNLEHKRKKIDNNEKVEFVKVIDEILLSYDATLNKMNVNIELDVDDVYVFDNSLLIKHLIANLVENAIKYNKQDGSVFISVKRENEKVLLTVKDTGIGIEEKNLNKIFDRFFRVEQSRNRSTGGSGLGLNLVKQICVIIDAKIEVESTINVGTTFKVYFNIND